MHSPCPDRRQPAALAKAFGMMVQHHRLLALSVLIVVLAASPASAQFCKVSAAPAFGATKIDIVPGGVPASTSAEIEYECIKEGHGIPQDYRICAAIDVLKPEQRDPNDPYRFYQTQSDGSRIAWVADNRSGGSGTGKGGHLEPLLVTANKEDTVSKGTMHLNVTYLGRQQQDRVRSGTYTNEYRLISNTMTGTQTTCPSGADLIGMAGSSSTPFTLTTTVLPTCQLEDKGQQAINFDPIDFGTRGSITAASANAGAIRATTNIDVRCTYDTDYTLDLDNGKNFADGTRRMKHGDNFLAYELFSKTASGTSSPWSKLSGKGNTVNTVNKHTVEGQLTTPIAVAPAAGSYEDTIVVTLTF